MIANRNLDSQKRIKSNGNKYLNKCKIIFLVLNFHIVHTIKTEIITSHGLYHTGTDETHERNIRIELEFFVLCKVNQY